MIAFLGSLKTRSLLRTLIRVFGWLAGASIASLIVGLSGIFLYIDPKTPDVETYRDYQHETPLRIFSTEGALLAEFGTRRLIPIAIEDVPELYLDAVISIEDKRFFEHQGIDWISLANDTLDLFVSSGVRRGASTITMQLPRNLADLSREQTFIRKFREMLLALKIERELTKEEILELYINVVPFGKHSYGVQAAAYTYYGKPLDQLNLAQLAMLAGIPKLPEAGNPINGPKWALERRNLVLRRMRDEGVISAQQYRSGIVEPITAQVHKRELDLYAPYPAEFVRQELFERFGEEIYSGFSVYTSIDVEHQEAAQLAVQSELHAFDKRYGYRGPERRIVLAGDHDPIPLFLKELQSETQIGELLPAVVTNVKEQSIDVLFRDGNLETIQWDGLRWARRSLGDAGVARSPRTAHEIVSVGDVVRVHYVDTAWQLSQIPEVQGALVAMDPRSGGVTAMVGGYSFDVNQYNHATQSQRQPGSGFKPFVYSAALANGVTPSSIFLDAPLVFADEHLETAYRPRNFSGTYNGPTRVREGLYRSINLVSIRVLSHVGAGLVRDFVTRFGFSESILPQSTQLAIGGGNMTVSPLQMVDAYAVIANGGYRVTPHVIERVVSLDGETVYQPLYPVVCAECGYADTGWDPATRRQSENFEIEHLPSTTPTFLTADLVLDERVSYLVDSMLRDVVRLGTGRRALSLGRSDLAGKTGTTDEAVDTWFNGYQQNLVATTWVGYTSRKSLGAAEYGSTRALPIWMDFMETALEDVPDFIPEPPNGIVSVKIDPESGLAARVGQTNAITEYFLAESNPVMDASQDSPSPEKLVRPEDIF